MLQNLLKLARSDRHLDPSVGIYYITEQCNLNCAYCEDFGSRRNHQNQRPLRFEDVQKVLKVIRTGVNALMLTGGEPLTHPDIDQIILHAKQKLKFKEITLISNGVLLRQHKAALHSIDRLIISLDCIDPQVWAQTIGAQASTAQAILANIRQFAAYQSEYAFQMIVNTVLTPETLPGAQAVLEFCIENKLLISFSPQAVNNWPRYELLVSPDYHAFIEKLRVLKHAGAPILCSEAYLKTLSNFEPYNCYPSLAPRIYPNGELSYPCRPLEKAQNGQGGRTINLLNFEDWQTAWRMAEKIYGQSPRTCHSCYQQCYAEPSLMQTLPLQLLQEWLIYPTSRSGNLTTYAPG